MPGTGDSQRLKAEMRARLHARRDALDRAQCDEASRLVCARLETIAAVRGARHIAGYASIRNEIDITPFLDVQMRRGCQVYLPRVVEAGGVEAGGSASDGNSAPHLEFVAVDDLEALVPGVFGIPEPAGAASPLDEIEVFLVPGLAFDRQGTRLGFGKGYYDRILRSEGGPRPLAVAIAYSWQVVDGTLPSEPHDIPMDAIATDTELIICSDRLAP